MNRLRWWVIPGAMIVLARVVTLGGQDGGAATGTPEDAVALPAAVAALDASGRRVLLPMAELAAQALVVTVPEDLAGGRVTMTAWRRLGGEREGTPWLTARPRVRSDATLPIAGLPAGRYDVKLVFGDGEAARTFVRDDIAVPGALTFVPGAAPGR